MKIILNYIMNQFQANLGYIVGSSSTWTIGELLSGKEKEKVPLGAFIANM